MTAARATAMRKAAAGIAALATLLSAAVISPRLARAQEPTPAAGGDVVSTAQCLACHSATNTTHLQDGTTLDLQIDRAVYGSSAHADLPCVSCHAGQATIPHPALEVASARDFTISMATTCAACHSEAEKEYKKNVHGISQQLGVKRAATCVDCHGAHDVRPVALWTRDERAVRCESCHQGATASFADSMIGHQEPSPSWFPILYIVERFMLVLILGALGFGAIHVELDVLRWAVNRVRGRHCPPEVRRWQRESDRGDDGGPWQGF